MNARPTRRHVLAAAAAVVITAKAGSVAAASGDTTHSAFAPGALADHIDEASSTYGVPREILLAIAYTSSRFDTTATSQFGGHGVMQLTQNSSVDTLGAAAGLTGFSERKLTTDVRANVLGAAALLRAEADATGLTASDRSSIDAWFEPVARWVQHEDDLIAKLEADAVYDVLAEGIDTGDPNLQLRARSVLKGDIEAFGATVVAPLSDDYGPAHWVAASTSNYRASNRPSSYAIDRVIVHTMQGYYAGTISWFQNPAASVAAHYCIRSNDGDITQMVRHKDVGWHAGNWNNRSIGIEHEGFVDNPSWYTAAMYESSAALTRHICDTYGLAKNRTTVVGHVEVPGATHTDPGPHWDWTRYMNLVTGGSTGWSVTVDNAANFTASSNWATASASGQHGSNHRHAQPVLSSDPGWWNTTIPAAGNYRVEVWYPQDPTNNTSTPYLVATTGGNQTVRVNQTTNGGRWNSLGTFALAAGTYNAVGISRWTSTTGWLEADAVRISAV